MILISTLRKMIAKNPDARVTRVTMKPLKGILFNRPIEFNESIEYFATDKQAEAVFARNAEWIKAAGGDPAVLNRWDYVTANEAAKAQGFDFLNPRQS